MEYLDNKASWEAHFTHELEALQQKIPTFDVESLSKSRLRLSLENKILDWKKYEAWATEALGCASIKDNIAENILKTYLISAQQAYALYANHTFWSQDLLPMFIWENQLVVFGLQYNPNLVKIQNHIFILAPPRVLSFFASHLLQNKPFVSEMDELTQMFAEGNGDIPLEGFGNDVQPISIDFKNLSSETVPAYAPRTRSQQRSRQTEAAIWELVSERFDEYVYESRKQFDAFIILKINYDLVRPFRIDPELEKQNVNEKLFDYSLKENNTLRKIVETGESAVVESSALGLEPLQFNHICVCGIKRNNNVVGFLLGFKNAKTSESDVALLEELSKESSQQAS